jgi:outer membrane protein
VAAQNASAADLDVSAAKGSFLPSLTIDADYGIEANDFALHSVAKAHPELGYLPTLGYFVTASLNIPVWDWGTLRSKLHQAQYKQEEARAELSQTQRQALRDLYSSYNEASVARSSVDGARHTSDLATESLRLINLRYQAGESNALEVVDAQSTLTLARGAYADAEMRYRMALATLQSLTGSF